MIPTDSNFEAKFSMEKEALPIPEDPPFHILFLGDYSGRENLSNSFENLPLDLKTHEIDRDNFEDILKKLNVSLRLSISSSDPASLILTFRELDDFHPDRIFRQIPLFADLRELRRELLGSDKYESAARQVRAWLDEDQTETNVPESAPAPPEKSVSSGNLLDDILSETKTEAANYTLDSADPIQLKRFIRDLVRPHIIRVDEDEREQLIGVVDGITGDLMRKILHHPHFQALESAWRGLYFVVRRVETSRDLKLFLMDISKEEVSTKLKSVNDLSDSDLFRRIVVESSEPWALICGNYEFDVNVDDVATLIRLAKIGNVITAPFVSRIKPGMLGIRSLSESPVVSDWNLSDETNESKLWTMLRTIPQSPSLGFAMPGFLVRLPYGEDSDPTEAFAFEEFTDKFEHQNYVWANSSFLIAVLLARSFNAFSWEIGTRFFSEVEGLPTHLYEEDGESKTKSCAEINMTHDACDLLLEQGIIPLISFRNTDSIKIADFRSVAFPLKNLLGRWK